MVMLLLLVHVSGGKSPWEHIEDPESGGWNRKPRSGIRLESEISRDKVVG